MPPITGIPILDFILWIVFLIVVCVLIVKVCQALGFTADSIMIPGLEGLLP